MRGYRRLMGSSMSGHYAPERPEQAPADTDIGLLPTRRKHMSAVAIATPQRLPTTASGSPRTL
jgi:hypothetical protein